MNVKCGWVMNPQRGSMAETSMKGLCRFFKILSRWLCWSLAATPRALVESQLSAIITWTLLTALDNCGSRGVCSKKGSLWKKKKPLEAVRVPAGLTKRNQFKLFHKHFLRFTVSQVCAKGVKFSLPSRSVWSDWGGRYICKWPMVTSSR